jgi:hypothetical protein
MHFQDEFVSAREQVPILPPIINGVMFCQRNVVKTWLDWNWQLETGSATNLWLAKDMNVHEDARIKCEELKIVQLIYFHLLV